MRNNNALKIFAHTNRYVYIAAISIILFNSNMMTDTRTDILTAHFKSIREVGFQGLRTDKVIADLNITKGAFYHYFKTKYDIGYAIVDEIISPRYIGTWKHLEESQTHPIDGIIDSLELLKQYTHNDNIKLGCPLNNLMQEMSPLDEGFRLRLQNIVEVIRSLIETALRSGQLVGLVRQDISARAVSYFILASVEGSYGIAKNLQSYSVFEQSIDTLADYVRTLRTE
jgi:TetR/AcrR family transcriptional repressor of nem operon